MGNKEVKEIKYWAEAPDGHPLGYWKEPDKYAVRDNIAWNAGYKSIEDALKNSPLPERWNIVVREVRPREEVIEYQTRQPSQHKLELV